MPLLFNVIAVAAMLSQIKLASMSFSQPKS